MYTINYASALYYKRKTLFEGVVGHNQKIMYSSAALDPSAKILDCCYFKYISSFIYLCHFDHLSYGIHSFNSQPDMIFLR